METIGRRDVAAEVRAVPMSVRGQFLQQFKGKMSIQCLALFFVAHAMTSLQFVFESVRLQSGASSRSVVKDSQFFVPTSILFGVQFGPQHANTSWVTLCQRTALVMSSVVS